MANLIINDDKILICNPGLNYTLKKDVVYELKFDNFTGSSYLKEGAALNMPKVLFEIEEDTKFINRVLKYHNSNVATQTTGVLLTGLKGSGKSMLAKRLALKSNLPIIVIDKDYKIENINNFFKDLNEEICIIIDEAEKYDYQYQKRALLSFLDGVQNTSKKLVILTANDEDQLDSNVMDRCSRIRYIREYDDNAALRFTADLCLFKGLSKDETETITKFITNNVKVKSFDNISSFIDEYILFKDEYTLDEILFEMNIREQQNSFEDDLDIESYSDDCDCDCECG